MLRTTTNTSKHSNKIIKPKNAFAKQISKSSYLLAILLWMSFLWGLISLGIAILSRGRGSSNTAVPPFTRSDNFGSTYQINFPHLASSLLIGTFTNQLIGSPFLGLLSSSVSLITSVAAQSLRIETIVPEFQVNNATAGTQYASAVASLSSGEGVIVWLSGQAIYMQRFAQDGHPLEVARRINTNNAASFPKIISFPNDDWCVVWISGNTIYARQFMRNGTTSSADFQVNSAPVKPDTGSGSAFTIGNLLTDQWAVVWGDKTSGDIDIYAQRLWINGSVIGSQFRVNTNTTTNQYNPTFKTLNTGDWLVVWQGYQTGDFDLYAQRFTSNGMPLGEEFRVNANVTDHQQSAVIASVNDNWLVAWLSGNGETNIYARWFAKNGTALEQEFQVNSDNTFGTRSNVICMKVANDSLVIMWQQSIKRSLQPYPLYARRFAENRSVVGLEFGMNINASTSQLSNFMLTNLGKTEYWIAVWSAQHQVSNADIYSTIFSFEDSYELPTTVPHSIDVISTSFLPSQQTSTTLIQTTPSIVSHISIAPTTLTSPRNSANTTVIPSSTSTVTTPIIAGVVGGGLGLAACLGAVGLYRKKSRANKAQNDAQKEAEISLQDKPRANSTSKNYSRIDEIKNPENQYDNAPKLEI